MTKKFDPAKSIAKIVAALRSGAMAEMLKDISDEDLTGIVLDGYVAGSNDTRAALNAEIKALAANIGKNEERLANLEAVEKSNSALYRKNEKRIASLEAALNGEDEPSEAH